MLVESGSMDGEMDVERVREVVEEEEVGDVASFEHV